MADQKKFEEMLERLINEDKAGAEELFHEIVVEKSREIYETLLAEEAEEDEDLDEASDEEDEDEVDESTEEDDDDEEVDEGFNLDEFEVEADPMAAMGGDMGDDMLGDIEAGDDEGDDEMDMDGDEDEELEDRVVDLEDALDELKAEFEKMMSGEEGDDEEGDDMDMDMGDEEGEEDDEKESFAFEAKQKMDPKTGKPVKDDKKAASKKSAAEQMREYVEKVSPAKMGDNGQNTKSPVAGKNDMGGTSANIVHGGESKGAGTQGGLANPSTKEDDMGNVNVPGGKASKSMKAMPKGHGAEKKGAGDTAANKKSTIGSR
jgi:hypothetical protein